MHAAIPTLEITPTLFADEDATLELEVAVERAVLEIDVAGNITVDPESRVADVDVLEKTELGVCRVKCASAPARLNPKKASLPATLIVAGPLVGWEKRKPPPVPGGLPRALKVIGSTPSDPVSSCAAT